MTQPLPRGPGCPAAAGLPKPVDLGETASPEGIGGPPAGTFPRKRLGRRTDRSPVRPATASRTPPFPEGDADINDAARPVDGLPRTLGDALPRKLANRRPHPPLDLAAAARNRPPKGRRATRDPTPSGEPAVLAGNCARLAVGSISDRDHDLCRNLEPRRASASRSRPQPRHSRVRFKYCLARILKATKKT